LVEAFAGRPPRFLQPETRSQAIRDQAPGLGGGMAPPLLWPRCPWGLGPELRDAKAPHWAPAEAADDSFGHAGASGCLAWHDPARDLSWALAAPLTADGGWLVRAAPRIGAALLAAAG